jgi:hypothetical protein
VFVESAVDASAGRMLDENHRRQQFIGFGIGQDVATSR